MSNTNTKMVVFGRSAKGRILHIGAIAHATIALSSDWKMPDINLPRRMSWAELNRGNLSKKQRR